MSTIPHIDIHLVPWVNGSSRLNETNMNRLNRDLALLADKMNEVIDALNAGNVSSVRVTAGAGLFSSNSTVQHGAVSTQISVAEGYKLPTEEEWEERQILVPVTWAELKALRDGGDLVPGQQYRITDYECTTSQENTSSAGHQFDVIVTADSENVLNENARACLHDGDTYFANCKLESWELKYCLDNDANRFEWAAPSVPSQITVDTDIATRDPSSDGGIEAYPEYTYAWAGDHNMFYYTSTETPKTGDACSWYHGDSGQYGMDVIEYAPPSGKGVIYWMRDEGGNEVPYDFKNIMFERHLNDGYIVKEGGDVEDVYTFTYSDVNTGDIKDASVVYQELFDDASCNMGVRDNLMKPLWSFTQNTGTPCSKLNGIVIFCNSEYDGGIFYGIIGNHFGFNCSGITLQDYCNQNEFYGDCSQIFMGTDSFDNTFSQGVYGITIGDFVWRNTFGANCGGLDLTVGHVENCIFDTGCYQITLAASSSGSIRYVHVHSGVRDKTITVSTLNATHSIDYYAPNSETIML